MKISLSDIREKFDQLLSKKISREEADEWATQCMEATDSNTIEFEPKTDEDIIWDAITYLSGIDIQTEPGKYLHSDDEIRETYNETWSENA